MTLSVLLGIILMESDLADNSMTLLVLSETIPMKHDPAEHVLTNMSCLIDHTGGIARFYFYQKRIQLIVKSKHAIYSEYHIHKDLKW
jgi:hypothetical protein